MISKTNKEGKIYKYLFEAAAEALVVTNSAGEILLVNPRACKLFGYKLEVLKGMKVESLIPKDKAEKHVGYRNNYHQNPSPRNMGKGMTLFGLKKNGSVFPCEISLNYFKEGEETYAMALISDITDRKKMEDQVKKEKEVAQNYLNLAGSLILILDKTGKVLNVNLKTSQLMGVPKEDIIGKFFHKTVLDTKKASGIAEKLQLMILGNKVLDQDLIPIFSKKHGQRSITWSSTYITRKNRDDDRILLAGVDVSDVIKAQELLRNLSLKLEKRVQERTEQMRQSQELYIAIAQNFPHGSISVLDRNLVYEFTQGKGLVSKNIDYRTLIGKSFIESFTYNDPEELKKQLQSVFEGNSVTLEIKRDEHFFLLNSVPLFEFSKEDAKILVVLNDITEQKKTQDRIKNALDKEKQLNELKSRFVSMASHEFRTPLSAVLSSVTLLEKYSSNKTDLDEQDLGTRRKKHFNRIRSSVVNLTGILNDFLSLDKIETGMVQCNPENFNARDLIKEVVDEMKELVKKGQKFEFKYKGEENVYLDSNMMRNIITNILSNAIKYTPEGGIIKVKSELSEINEEKILQIECHDSGIGIPDKDKPNMFERFFRAGNSTNIQGTGLGLNIVKRYLELMSGEIRFESKENEGTSFYIKIPAQFKLKENEEDSID